eukprot:TRINITY_DN446_c0_g1_i2.p1 TRINITY_DN446_c0_g1~~TRINITY_DN446_c0_g1_i2.p1  ORF type:complete len:434 (-),score=75.59 TRINITY_DN446_c0_g1_i2:21-1322(-)
MLSILAKAVLVLAFVLGSVAESRPRHSPYERPSRVVDGEGAAYDLVMVQVITRHGARSPYTILPAAAKDYFYWNCTLDLLSTVTTEPSNKVPVGRLYRKKYLDGREPVVGDCSLGQLTAEGAMQHRELGANLRSIYVDQLGFLSPTFDESQIYIRSTNVERTVESAINNFLGLYPPSPSAASCLPEILNIETMDNSMEDMTPGSRCLNLYKTCDYIQTTPSWQAELNSMQPLYQYIQNLWNFTNWEWIDMYDLFAAREFAGAPMLPGITPQIIDSIYNISAYQINSLYTNMEVTRLGIGSFVGELLNNIQMKVSGVNSYKYMFFSGHDTTIAPLYYVLNPTSTIDWPPFASYIILELLQNPTTQQYAVKFTYNGQDIKIPACPDVVCPLDVFSAYLQPYIPTNFQQECGMTAGMRRIRTNSLSSPNQTTKSLC